MLCPKTQKSLLVVCILLLPTQSDTWNIAVAFQGPDQEWVPVTLNAVQIEIKRSIGFGKIKSTLRQDLYLQVKCIPAGLLTVHREVKPPSLKPH